MFRSIVFRTLIFSVLLHAGLVIFLWNDKGSGDSTVSINVQYQGGDGGASEAVKRPSNKVGAAGSRTGVGVSGESLGLHAVYPKLSRVLGESGLVRIEIKDDQALINTSSGFKRLDESALASINDALKSGALKQALAGRDSLLINFIFRLK